ncbi:uncharacterized protein LOC144132317 [Amblyomma americanum]
MQTSDDRALTTSTAAELKDRFSLDIPVLLDGHSISALVDTGAEFSIISGKLAVLLKKATTPCSGVQIRTAGGHIITPLGQCTARVQISDSTFIVSCLVLRDCSRGLILGVDFLRENGAVIDLRHRTVTFSTAKAHDTSDVRQRSSALRISIESALIPTRSSVIASVESNDGLRAGPAVAEGNLSLLLTHGICMARSVVHLHDGRSELLIANFTSEPRHLFRATVVAWADQLADVIECFASEAMHHPGTSLDRIDINSRLSATQSTTPPRKRSASLSSGPRNFGLISMVVKVVTDHYSLCWLTNLQDTSGRLARWSLCLQEFDYTIAYKSGCKHEDADTLSRTPVEQADDSAEDDNRFLGVISSSDLVAKQRADAGLRSVMHHLEGHASNVPRHFFPPLVLFLNSQWRTVQEKLQQR